MRKEYMILSVAAVLSGCGYDDGTDQDFLPALPVDCQSDNACRVGSERLGACIAGKCQRYCETTDDCEADTVCESNLCRPVVPCRDLNFEGESNLASKYQNRKCVQIFSHTPTNAWENLREADVVFDTKFVAANGAETDFTSDNFKFVLPKRLIETGTNFSSVTFMILTYMLTMIDTARDMYVCMKPQLYDFSSKDYIPVPGITDDSYVNTPDSLFNFSEFTFSELNPETVPGKCEEKSMMKNMKGYMEKYVEYFGIQDDSSKAGKTMEFKLPKQNPGENDDKYETIKYVNVNETSGEQTFNSNAKDQLVKVTNALTEPYTLATQYWDSSDKNYTENYFESALKNGYHIKKNLQNRDLLSAVAKEYKYTMQKQCADVVKQLETLATFSDLFTVVTLSQINLGREWAEQMKNVIVQDYMYKDFGNGLAFKPISVCNEDYYDAVKGKNQANTNKILYCTQGGTPNVSSGSIDQMYAATYDMLTSAVANDLKVACVQGLNIIAGTKITSILDGTGLLFQNCTTSQYILSATLGDKVKMADGYLSSTLDEYLTHLSSADINNLQSLINPSNLWITAKNPNSTNSKNEQNLIVIKTNSSFDSNDLIISQRVTLNDAMLGITNQNGFVVVQNFENGDSIKNTVNKVNNENYINLLNNDEGASSCTDGKCSFSFIVDKVNANDTFSCGGVTYTLNNVSGYVVLKDSDQIGKRKVK